MKGQRVVVRAYGDKPLVRVVWGASRRLVYVAEENEYQRLIQGKNAFEPIGFPREDVFQFTPDIELSESIDWSELAPWRD